MRKWGSIVTTCYIAILLGLVFPGIVLISGMELKSIWILWAFAVPFILGEAVLLFLAVDTSRRRLKPRTHILISALNCGLLFALLTFGVITSLMAAVYGDTWPDALGTITRVLSVPLALWLIWGVFFFLYQRGREGMLDRITSWLLKGSVLELLVAVPCHVIVRRRHDCCAPMVTGFGIATGIAIMLLSFGPGILLLYKKHLDGYGGKGDTRAQDLDRSAAI